MKKTKNTIARRFLTIPILLLLIPLVSCDARGGASISSPTAVVSGRPADPSGMSGLGTFEVSFVADPSCTSLPPAVRTRSYTGVLNAGSSRTRLSGARFAPPKGSYPYWDVVYTRIEGEAADIWFQDPPLWELLSDDTYVVIYGDAHGRMGSGSSTLPFWGRIEYCAARALDDYPECDVPETTCESANHHVILRRISPE